MDSGGTNWSFPGPVVVGGAVRMCLVEVITSEYQGVVLIVLISSKHSTPLNVYIYRLS